MTLKAIPSRPELVKQSLDARRHVEKNLFDTDNPSPDFWKLSELSILYPNFFDTQNPVQPYFINKINGIITDAIPEFHDLQEQPVHIMNTRETYNIYSKETNQIKTVKYGINQKLTNIACEFLFRQCQGTELEQAYFLYPNKNAEELAIAAKDLHFERVRDQIAHTSKLLSAIIRRAYGTKSSSFSDTWSLMWKILYGVESMDVLRERFNIKASPIDYMKINTLIFINSKLQEIVLKFADKGYYNIEEVKEEVASTAAFARAHFYRYGSRPEEQLTEKNSYYIIERIRKHREKFWKEYYPISLQQR